MNNPKPADSYHIPVLAEAVCVNLITRPDGVYIDGTLGGGGHAWHILSRLAGQGLLIGIDRDPQARKHSMDRLAGFANFRLFDGVFSEMQQALQENGREQADGILLDLGVSSHQIDSAGRGFSYSQEAPLDMRMDDRQLLTAEKIVNEWSGEELSRIFYEYGEERRSGAIARALVQKRSQKAVRTTGELKEIIRPFAHPKFMVKTLARIFQALRIAVNEELDILDRALVESFRVLRPGGRLVVISYHSLEDRRVKTFFQQRLNPCTCPPELPVCVCGRQPEIKVIKPYPIKPDAGETARNARARSAIMRVVEKL
jgi:16S rRNA (cytosine1402-N4)-methyltransferase